MVFWRGGKDSGLGHVGFYRGEDSSRIWTLGGNEDDQVQIAAPPKQTASFGLIGYYWPKSVRLPARLRQFLSRWASDRPEPRKKPFVSSDQNHVVNFGRAARMGDSTATNLREATAMVVAR